MSNYYYKSKPIYATSEGVKYSDLNHEKLEVEISILKEKREYLTSEIDYIEYHKEIINSVLGDILNELDKIDKFLIDNSNIHTHIYYDFLQEGETERKYISWQWNGNSSPTDSLAADAASLAELDILLKKYQDLFEIPFSHLRFLHLLYGGNSLEINLENGNYKPTFESFFIGETISNKKSYPLSNNVLEKVKKLIKAKKSNHEETEIIKSNQISITSDIAIYFERGSEDIEFSIDGSHDQKIQKKWNTIISRNHFSPNVHDREPDYLNFNSSGTTRHEKKSFWENWVEPAMGKGSLTKGELKSIDNERAWYKNKKGWTPEAGYSYDSSKNLDHNVTYMALREIRMKYFGYMFDRNVNWLHGLHDGYSANNRGGPVPMQINIVDDKKILKKMVEHYIEFKIDNKLRKLELMLRGKKKSKEKLENKGYVYVLSNKAYPNIYKIGSTYSLPEERAEELTGTGHLTPFKVVGKIKLQSAEYYEKLIHKLLKKYRVKEGREFFKLDLNKINQCLKQVSQISETGTKKITFIKLQKEIDF